MEFQIQLGPKLYPEYPVRSVSECVSILKQTLNIPDRGLHSVGIDYKSYNNNKFVFAMSFEKVPEASWTGANSNAGQLLVIKCNGVGSALTSTNLPDTILITLQSENLLEIRDVGISSYD